jgi:D-alanyl-D-alanine carboxypeptidase
MLGLTRKIAVLRVPHPRAVAPLVAVAVAAIILVALLTRGGDGSTWPSTPGVTVHARTQPAVPVPLAHAYAGRCPHALTRAGVAGVSPSAQARRDALARVLDGVLRAERSRLNAPAVTAAVVVCGHVVWADATGVLEWGSNRPADNGSLFVVNSAVKTVVATMVMREIQDGHLSLDTRLSQFYPWLPHASQITVRMLLNMTSGLPDYLHNRRVDWVINHEPRHHWTVEEILTGLGTGLGSPRLAPGRAFDYSDTNYIVLGAILEQITHRSIQRDFEQLIARPLGITSATFVPTRAAKAHMAHPYVLYRDGTLHSKWIPGFGLSTAVWGPVFTDGGLAASSIDMATFANALFDDRLVDAAEVSQMTRIGPRDYGLGMRDRMFDGHLWLGHRGYFQGFETEDWSDPSRQLTIAVSTNLQINGAAPTSTRIWKAIAQVCDRHSL